ncbi:glycosyltransferase family 2 protein [Paraglaciecola marina]|uniref:glycosyltransferase family 2 protein n=1 Tax=Paraglaciecola marina TaxID=2500157 RepID=UPI00105E7738|nr:glycosyltransferase family 2 protein [Paraglaciecola marina]
MNKHHQHSSFNTFAQRVLGFDSLSESTLEKLDGELKIDFNLEHQETIKSALFSNDNLIIQQSSYLLDSALGSSSTNTRLVHQATKQNYELVKDLVYKLNNVDEDTPESDIKNNLLTLSQTIGFEYFDLSQMDIDVASLLSNDIILSKALPQLIELAIIYEHEDTLALNILGSLPLLTVDELFMASPQNVRALQKLLSYFATNESSTLSKILSVNIPDSFTCQDAYISLCISVCRDKNDVSTLLSKLPIDSLSLEEYNYPRIVETFNRSPVKLNFIAQTWLFERLFESLDLKNQSHVSLCFRAYYFLDAEKTEAIENIDKIEVLNSVLLLDDTEFNVLYRDIRRSEKVILTADQAFALLETTNTALFSLNKWLYVFTLLSPLISEKEKLAFYEKVLIDVGIPTINSQAALTLAASIGLKQLSNGIINQTLKAYGVIPCLPESTNYDLENVFENVIKTNHISTSPEGNEDCITVVITTFNPNIKLLQNSIASIINQDYKNIEIIVIDDCSNIEISQQVKAICDNDSTIDISYFRNEINVGQYISRNIAISRAKGFYIAIQDDDDVSHPQRFSSQLKEMNNSGALACFTKHVRYSDDGRLSVDDPRELLVFGDGPASLIFHKSLIDMVGGFRNYRSRGDIDFRTRIEVILGKDAIKFIDTPLYVMRSSLKTISSLYEYLNGDQLEYFRNRIQLLSKRKAKDWEYFQ